MIAEHTRAACLREVQSSIKDSVKQLVEDKIANLGVGHLFKITDLEIVGPNDSLMIFKGLRSHTASSIKSLEGFTRAFVEEAQTISQHSLDILIPTIRTPGAQMMFAWNPVDDDDPIEVFFEENKADPDFVLINVTYRDNPWLPAKSLKDMERDRARNPEKYQHVWLGQYRRHSESRVFKNFRVGTYEVPKGARPYYGGDWGFAIDPNVLVRCWIDGRTLYIDQEACEVGCSIDKTPFLFGGCDDKDLIKLNPEGWKALTADERKWRGVEGARKWPITADSARPETIDYMRRHGFPHIQGARKGAGSIEEGVEFLQSFDIVVNPNCPVTIDELTHYSYKVDKLTSKVLPVLEDKKNNVIDALRYSAEQVRAFDGGTVYSVPETSVIVPAIEMPKHWPRIWALDIDGAKASALWASVDKESDTLYVYAECVVSRSELSLVAEAIRKRGLWIPGLFDHIARKRSKQEGSRITEALLDLRLDVFTVTADAEAGVAEVSRRLSTKRIKVFANCTEWAAQYRAYRRGKDGDLVEESDGLMRCLDLLALSGSTIAASSAEDEQEAKDDWASATRDLVTGY